MNRGGVVRYQNISGISKSLKINFKGLLLCILHGKKVLIALSTSVLKQTAF